MPFLSVSDVSKQFGGVTAVDHVSFAVDRGEVVGFLGPNGAGKTTTMRMITQYIEPDAGAIRLDGVAVADAARDAKRRIGYLPENNPLYSDMLVADYLAFIADLRELVGPLRRQWLDDAITSTGLETVYYRPIGDLSKGYRRRGGRRPARHLRAGQDARLDAVRPAPGDREPRGAVPAAHRRAGAVVRAVWTIARRELKALFDLPTAYILLVVFVAANDFL